MAGHLGHSFTRVVRLNPINFLTPLGGRGGAVVCFASDATPEKKKKKMEEDEEQHADSDNTHRGDAMSHSFGDGYSTRSDWEGFGGIYARNPSDTTHPGGSILRIGMPRIFEFLVYRQCGSFSSSRSEYGIDEWRRRDVGVIPRRLSSFVNSDSGGSSHPEPNPRENHTKNQETRRPLSSSRRRVSTVGFAAVVLREAAADADSAKQTRGPPRGRRREAERRRETGSRELESGHAR
ncbi:hypothetical protein BHE74_00016546 [Ensete ventricosum]|nr:hypothetical protein BHE74_00016546 [Ensete ventricosum]